MQVLQCNKGIHRADTCGRFAGNSTNSIHESGDRLFNAHFWSLSQAGDVNTFFETGCGWVNSPWCLQPAATGDQRYAFDVCSSSRECWDNFQKVYNFIDEWSQGLSEPPNKKARIVQLPDHPRVAQPPEQPLPNHLVQPRLHGDSAPREPPTPPPPPSRPESSQSEAPSAAIDEARPMPDWASFNPDPTLWWQFLNEMEIDDVARQSLFLLAQLSVRGQQEANTIIFKLVHKNAQHMAMHHPSGFVHACCLNARRKILE